MRLTPTATGCRVEQRRRPARAGEPQSDTWILHSDIACGKAHYVSGLTVTVAEDGAVSVEAGRGFAGRNATRIDEIEITFVEVR